VKTLARLTLVGVLLAAAVPARAGEVKLSFSNGGVTIIAADASPRQIMAEWAKLGQVTVTNLERLSGSPVSLQLIDVPEGQALEILLRGTAGYVAAPRAAVSPAGNTSRYDRILLMPGAAPPASAVAASAPAPQPYAVGRGRQVFPVVDPSDDDDNMPRTMPGPNGMPNGADRDVRLGRGGRADQQGQPVMPGTFLRQPASSYSATPTQPSMPAQPGMPTQPTYDAAGNQRPSYGASTPGMSTAPAQVQQSPYSNAGPAPAVIQAGSAASVAAGTMPSVVPGQAADTPTTEPGANPSTGAARPGEVTTGPTPAQFRNPYGLPEPVNPPVTNPNANPYGLPTPVKQPATNTTTTGSKTPGSTTPTAPIKDPGEKG
jgi:hypothetical protein